MAMATATRPRRRTKRQRLLEAEAEAALWRRATELLGIGLIGLGALLAMILWTWHPDDPSWLAASTAPPQNAGGWVGAMIANPLVVMIGWAPWGLVAALAVWGLRLILHAGVERTLVRMILIPIWIAILAVFLETHVPPASWAQETGVGGAFGAAVLTAAMEAIPLAQAPALLIATLLLLALTLLFGGLALGADAAEARRGGRAFLVGLVRAYEATLWGGRHALRASAATAAQCGSIATGLARAGVAQAARFRAAREERRALPPPSPEEIAQASPTVASADPDTAPARAIPTPPDREPDGPAAPRQGADGLEDLEPPLRAPAVAAASGPAAAALARRLGPAVDEPDTPTAQRAGLLSRLTGRIAGGAKPAAAPAPDADPEPDASTAPDADPAPDASIVDRTTPDELRPAPEAPAHSAETGIVAHDKPRAKKSARALAEEQPALFPEDGPELPPLSLLTDPATRTRHHLSDEMLSENARMLENVLDDYGVRGEITAVRPGPVVTMYELEPAAGLKASRVINLADDIARSMSALAARVSTIPGRTVIGIELPNEKREIVLLREILADSAFGDTRAPLPLALGKDIGGEPVVANLAKMPHLLIAGTTGSGKSVAINTMILSLLYTRTPEECRLIMIDPKMLELSVYDGIPHLLSPVVTDPKKAVVALKWVVGEMEERYRKMSKLGVRNIDGYNAKVRDALERGEAFTKTIQTGFDDDTGDPIFETEEFSPQPVPYIVVVVDEMADLMMVAGKEIEACIQRLAQMARASGIHIIMATQRPSVDVITGTIKANFPTRISFQVTSKVDSRTILGEMGAEQLLGQGDMLYMAGGGRISRVHGPFVSDEEVEEIVAFLKTQGTPDYVAAVQEGPDEDAAPDIDLVLGLGGNTNSEDALYDQALAIVARDRKCSTSYIQRKLGIGYNKAARLVERMETEGAVTPANAVGKREILVPEASV